MRAPTKEHCGNVPHRVSPASAWPLRGPDGLTYAERKAREAGQCRTPNAS